MAIDRLQDKIRKTKCPIVVNFGILPEQIPPYLIEECGDFISAYQRFCEELLLGLRDDVPAVRFDFGAFAIHGAKGLQALERILNFAKKSGYYVLLDGISNLSAQSASNTADVMMRDECVWKFDGYIVQSYIGSDGLRPFVDKIKESGKDLFVVIRTANRSAPEVQDLLTGSRLVHMAAADIVNRFAEISVGKCGYSQVAFVAAASSAESLRSLRGKYKRTFLLLDGADYPNANAKNCSFAFDRLGYGAAACVGTSVTAAWMESDTPNSYVEQAAESVLRMKKNLGRYVSIL